MALRARDQPLSTMDRLNWRQKGIRQADEKPRLVKAALYPTKVRKQRG